MSSCTQMNTNIKVIHSQAYAYDHDNPAIQAYKNNNEITTVF